MGTKSVQINAYIEKSAPFARPILIRLRKLIHAACPQVEESINFSPSQQREYVEWVAEAKTEATKQKRLATAIEWLAEGKSRNWKYEKC